MPLIPVSFPHPPGFSFSLGLVQQGGLYNPHGREYQPWVCCQQNTLERSWHLSTFSSQYRGSLQPSLIGRDAVLQSHVLFWKVWYLLRRLLYSLQGKSLSNIFKVPLQICNSPEAEIWASHSISRSTDKHFLQMSYLLADSNYTLTFSTVYKYHLWIYFYFLNHHQIILIK